jgi:ATP-dependent Lon protease
MYWMHNKMHASNQQYSLREQLHATKLELDDEQRRAQAREVQLEHDATQKKLAEELETMQKKLQEVRSDPT